MRYFSYILLLIMTMLAEMPALAADKSGNPFIIKHGNGDASQRIMSGDSIEPFYYEYISEVFIDHVQVPDAMFTVNHDEKNRKIYLSGVTGGPTRSYDVRIWGLVTNDTLTKERVTRSGKLTVLRPYLDYKGSKEIDIDADEVLDTIRLNYTKFTYAVWNSELPYGMKLVKDEDHCSIVASEPLEVGTYTFKIFGADSLYFTKDSVVVTDGGGRKIDTLKFSPKEYRDSITFKINVYNGGGLTKIGTGGTKQVVELGDSIETFGFEWGTPGKLIHEPIAKGLEMVIDSAKHNIWIQGAPTEVGLHEFQIAYKANNTNRLDVYDIEVAVLDEIRPIFEPNKDCLLKQIVSVGDMINDVVLSYYNADTVWVEKLPEGIMYEINEEDGEITLYGTLRESGNFDIKVHARNAKYETEIKISLSTSDKTGDITGIDDVMSDKEERIATYDLLGRRVSPEKMGNKAVFIIKKKIVIRK